MEANANHARLHVWSLLIGLALGVTVSLTWENSQKNDLHTAEIIVNKEVKTNLSIQPLDGEHVAWKNFEQATSSFQKGLSLLKLIASSTPDEYPQLWDKANQLGKYQRRDLRAALLQEWASQNPKAALNFLIQESNGFIAESILVYQLYEGWALRDPDEAFANVSAQLSKNRRKTAYQAILDITARNDPYHAAALYQELAREDYRVMCHMIALEMTKRSPRDAIEFIEEMPDGHHRNSMLLRISQAISIDNPNQAVALVSQISHFSERNKALTIILGRLASNDPRQAIHVYQNLEPGLQDDSHLYPIIKEWAQQDIQATLGYFDNRELSSAEWLLLRHAYNAWGNTPDSDHQAIFQASLKLGKSAKAIDIQSRCIHATISQDVNKAKDLIESLSPGPLQDKARSELMSYMPRLGNDAAIEYAQETGDKKLIRDAVTAIAESMKYKDPAAGAEYFKNKELGNPDLSSLGLTRVLEHWTKEAPQAAVQWVVNQENLPNHDTLVSKSLQVTARIDPSWTAEVLETLDTSDENKKFIHANIAHQWALNNPQAALDWAIEQKQNRESSILKITSIWAETDPEAAETALEGVNMKP